MLSGIMNHIKYRPAKPTDIPGITALWLEFMDVHAAIDPRFPLSEDAEQKFQSYINQVLADQNAFVLVAEADSSLLGYCLARVSQHPAVFTKQTYGYINDLFVTSRQRRKGIGQALFEATATALYNRGIPDLEVSLVPRNEIASSFWRKLGFTLRLETLRLERDST